METLSPPMIPDSFVSTTISLVTWVLPSFRAAPEHFILPTCCLANSSPPVILQRKGDPAISLSS
uniref:Uncharacterized protein n=1 Tax=Tetranychus urticae TaxID=32264 RepID=T1KVN8_TETUR